MKKHSMVPIPDWKKKRNKKKFASPILFLNSSSDYSVIVSLSASSKSHQRHSCKTDYTPPSPPATVIRQTEIKRETEREIMQ